MLVMTAMFRSAICEQYQGKIDGKEEQLLADAVCQLFDVSVLKATTSCRVGARVSKPVAVNSKFMGRRQEYQFALYRITSSTLSKHGYNYHKRSCSEQEV